jgi:hypothetical protein
MRILLFTVLNCIACDSHRKELIAMADNEKISYSIYNIDDPQYFHLALKGMQLYGIQKTPSVILLKDSKQIITIQGVARSIEKLKQKIDEHR